MRHPTRKLGLVPTILWPAVDKPLYLIKFEKILNNNTKFSKVDIPIAKRINYIKNLIKKFHLGFYLPKCREIIE